MSGASSFYVMMSLACVSLAATFNTRNASRQATRKQRRSEPEREFGRCLAGFIGCSLCLHNRRVDALLGLRLRKARARGGRAARRGCDRLP